MVSRTIFTDSFRLQQRRAQDAGGDGVGVGQDDVVGDLLAGRDEGQRQSVLGLQGQQVLERGPCCVRHGGIRGRSPARGQ